MESNKIEMLLDAYFEGTTTIQEEQQLREYFSNGTVAPHLESYAPMFQAFEQARQERSQKEIELPKPLIAQRRWWLSIAASAVIAIGVAGYVFTNTNQGLTQEEQEALAAFEKTKAALQQISMNFNEGAEELTYIDEFNTTTKKILK
ncbi:anti-sigma factor [Luteirhabdus pelagi]|uniref:hypothetical protein n=1 Tax=Luteirhabdus pelagi TaxID=2792783 RepID=UPI00193998CB|nr:hypothetical protein [Luteirhabdus pelagi]